MNCNFAVSADTTCDLSPELRQRFNIHTVPLTVNLAGDCFKDGDSYTPEDMYRRYAMDGALPQTSAVGIQEFYDFFSQFTEKGMQVLHIDLSSELSGTFNNARLAASAMEGVFVIDSRTLSTGIALLAIEAAQCRDKGMSAADTAAYIESIKEKVNLSFVLDSLEFMWKGGRCSGITALGANLLKLKPAIEMREGSLKVYKKFRGGIDKAYLQYMEDRLKSFSLRKDRAFITESGRVEESSLQELKKLVEAAGVQEVFHTLAGCTVSSHCGPKTLGIAFIEE